MSAKWTFWAWEKKIKSAPKKLVLLQLANNANDDGHSWYSISKMSVSCGISERTFQRHIKELEEEKILLVERRSNRPSIYTLQDFMEVIFLPGGDTVTGQDSFRGDRVTGQGDRVTPLGVTESRPILTVDLNNTPNNKDSLSQPEAKPKKYKYSEDDLKLAEWMYERVIVINPTAAKPNFENWANTIRLMQEINKKTRHEICDLFDWSNKDSFWCTNILCPEKLRKQWDSLVTRKLNGNGYNSNQRDVNKISDDFEQPEGWSKGNFSGEGGADEQS